MNCEDCDGEGVFEVECYDCGGTGEQDCPICEGDGCTDCPTCGGELDCKVCNGDGVEECESCYGEGVIAIDCESCGPPHGLKPLPGQKTLPIETE